MVALSKTHHATECDLIRYHNEYQQGKYIPGGCKWQTPPGPSIPHSI